MTVGELLAASPSPTATVTSTEPPGHAKVLNDDTVSPGWLGLVVFLALAVATVLLLRSFRHQLAKVPKRFDDPPPPKPTSD
jgi:membrane protein implicated in regulation of membrane protease activity